jgi:chaperonin cofactor prefoldin
MEINRQFAYFKAELNLSLEQMEKRFGHVETRMDKVEGRLEHVETRLYRLDARMDEIAVQLVINNRATNKLIVMFID